MRTRILLGVPVLVAMVATGPAAAAPEVTTVKLPKPANGLVAGPDGNLWVTQDDSVLQVKPHGGKPTAFPLPEGRAAGAIAVGADDALWFASQPGYVGRVTTGGVMSEFGPLSGDPTAIAAGPDGNVWLAEPGMLARVTPLGEVTEFALGDTDPQYLTAGPDNALWFTDPDTVGRATPDGAVTLFPTDLDARGIAAGPGDGLWLAGAQSIASVATDGTITPGGTADRAVAVATGQDGAGWFTATDTVGRVTPDGQVSVYPVAPGKGGTAIATGPDGAMWFTHADALIGRVTVPPAVDDASASDVRSRVAKVAAKVRANALPSKVTVSVRDGAGRIVAEKERGIGPGPEVKEVVFTLSGLAPDTGHTASVRASSDAGESVTAAATSFTTQLEPTLEKTVVVKPSRGKIRVRGKSGWEPLDGSSAIPVDATVDATRGAVSLESALADGTTQTGVFHGGRFRVRQSAGGMTRVVLAGRVDCRSDSVASASATGKRRRKLWGSDGGGRFQTQGRDSVATVRGTKWLTVDTCRGTLTRVTEGAVTVRPRGGGRAVVVKAGERHLVRHG